MNRKESNKLKIGDRVIIWQGTEHEARGEVIEHGYCASKFRWDDGEVSVIHSNDMANVVRELGFPARPRDKARDRERLSELIPTTSRG